MDIDQVRLYPYSLPLRYPLPLKGSVMAERRGVIIELRAGSRYGYGDVAPLADFSCESLDEARKQLEQLFREVGQIGFGQLHGYYPSVVFGVESAVWSLEQSVWYPAPECAPLLLGETSDILRRLHNPKGSWPGEFKLKTGKGSAAQDIKRILAVLDMLPEKVKLRLDANQRWTFRQAVMIGKELPSERIAYIEEPVADAGKFPAFYHETGIHYALDETVQQPEYQFRPQPGLAALILKPTLVGGIDYCRSLIQQAKAVGVRTIFSSSFESSVGIRILQQLSALYTPGELPGLDTVSAFKTALVAEYPPPGQPLEFSS